jgi:hypothetical protein
MEEQAEWPPSQVIFEACNSVSYAIRKPRGHSVGHAAFGDAGNLETYVVQPLETRFRKVPCCTCHAAVLSLWLLDSSLRRKTCYSLCMLFRSGERLKHDAHEKATKSDMPGAVPVKWNSGDVSMIPTVWEGRPRFPKTSASIDA